MDKKSLAIGIIAIIAIGFGGTMTVLYFLPGGGGGAGVGPKKTLVVATMYGPIDLDPIYLWDSASGDVVDQVVEGLFAYDLGDPDLTIIPRLASAMGTWNGGADEYTVPLKTGVKFHDGTDFNAAAVVAHWDRIEWAINFTGTNTAGITQTSSLYEFPDGTPIVNNTVDNGDNSVTFFLNAPYIPFVALLCWATSYIQSPTYMSAYTDAYINTASGDIVGTGPFVYDSYEACVEVLFHAFDDYHGGRAELDFIILSEIVDANARNAALLSGDVDLLQDPMDAMLGVFDLTTGITLEEGPRGTVTQYLGMNNRIMNRTWREAISYAVDYDYLLDELRGGNAYRMKSPIPEGIIYNNQTHPTPTLDLVYARGLVQSMGFGVGLNTSELDTNTEWDTTNFMTFNYTYNIGNDFRENMLVLLQDNLAKIGITVTDAGGTWDAFVGRLNDVPAGARNELELFWVGWGPDYNDPSNFINPLFTNATGGNSNGAQYNGYLEAIEAGRDEFDINDNVQLLMDAALFETNAVTREAMYDRIQELLKLDFAWAWGYVGRGYRAYIDGMTGYDLNAMGNEWWYPIHFT
jgi:peptide/nickel transport system substrate-binding protein